MGAMIFMVLSVNLIIFTIMMSSDLVKTRIQHSPCLYKDDPVYGGVLVDCQGQSLLSFPPPDWLPPNTTSLLLQFNSISRLDNISLVNATELRYLSVAGNKLISIDPSAFRYNSKLEVLDLESNHIRLDNRSIKEPPFHYLHSLVELRLNDNHNVEVYDSPYPRTLLAGLENLRSLSLDTFQGDLFFNDIFKETKNLTSLVLEGGLTTITNDSFQDFEFIHLRQLTIRNSDLMFTEKGAFRYLRYLDSLSLIDCKQGTQSTLESLAPFVHRNFTSLIFNGIDKESRWPSAFKRDSELTQYSMRYLSKICVKHFSFVGNSLFFIEPGTVGNTLWSHCLESIDVSDNPLLGEVIELLRLPHSLRSVRILNRKYSFLNTRGRFNQDHESFEVDAAYRDVLNKRNCYRNGETFSSGSKGIRKNMTAVKTKIPQVKHLKNMTIRHNVRGRFIIPIPPNLIYFNLNGFSSHSTSLDDKTQVIGGDNLEEMYLSDTGLYLFTGTVRGIENVKILDISRNDGTQLTASFLRSFPNVFKLNMSSMGLVNIFDSSDSSDIFKALSNLEYLDLSKNGLYILPNEIFSNNKKLKYISLAGNRFKTFPFDIGSVPSLIVLDIRINSFLHLSNAETGALEQHAKNLETFLILLQGNIFSCSCSSILFLQWLQMTMVELDKDRNYSCTLENGQLTTTSNMKGIDGLWRHCHGKDAFLTSLILVCLTALGFSIFTLVTKFRTQITATVFQYFSKNFAFKTPQDYVVGVYIGYADHDADFACVSLRKFIENQLHLSTYVHHRDLLPASDIAESIVSAINSSWRVLLVVTEHYLENPWSFLAMKTAVYSVTPSNPGRLVIVVTSDHVRHHIPSCLLTAVSEESIVKLTKEGEFSESQEQALRTVLLA